jgi:hypothetical protein
MDCKRCSELKAARRAIEEKLNSRDLSHQRKIELNAELDPVAFELIEHKIWHNAGCW